MKTVRCRLYFLRAVRNYPDVRSKLETNMSPSEESVTSSMLDRGQHVFSFWLFSPRKAATKRHVPSSFRTKMLGQPTRIVLVLLDRPALVLAQFSYCFSSVDTHFTGSSAECLMSGLSFNRWSIRLSQKSLTFSIFFDISFLTWLSGAVDDCFDSILTCFSEWNFFSAGCFESGFTGRLWCSSLINSKILYREFCMW